MCSTAVPCAGRANDNPDQHDQQHQAEGVDTATRVQFIEYAPDHSDPVHRHDEGEVFVITEGELWVNDARNGPGSIICIPRSTDYAVRSGAEGARFFRVVVP